MSKRLPKLRSDQAAEKFLERDLSAYISPANFKKVTFEFAPKTKTLSLRLSEELLQALRRASQKHGISYQRFIRLALEEALRKDAA